MWPAAALVGVVLAPIGAGAVVVRRVEVHGLSMTPTLMPGDRLLVLRVPRFWPLATGTLVALVDPRQPSDERVLIKRVAGGDRHRIEVRGDNPEHSTDSRVFGPVPRRSLLGVVVYRYAPAGRTGPIRDGRRTP